MNACLKHDPTITNKIEIRLFSCLRLTLLLFGCLVVFCLFCLTVILQVTEVTCKHS